MLLTTYDIALVDQDFLSQIPWQYAVIDEAQRLKNPNSVCFHLCLSCELNDRSMVARYCRNPRLSSTYFTHLLLAVYMDLLYHPFRLI